jgi:hypothetical protein
MGNRVQSFLIGMDENGAARPLRTDASGRVELVISSGGGIYRRTFHFYLAGTLTVGAKPQRIPNLTGGALSILSVRLDVAAAPTGQALIVDVNKNGATIFTTPANRPQVPAGASAGSSSTIDVTGWADGEYLHFDVDQVGSGTPGADLTVSVVVG